MTYCCPLYFSCGLGTAKGYITTKYIKNEQFYVLLGTLIVNTTCRTFTQCGRRNGKLRWPTIINLSHNLQETCRLSAQYASPMIIIRLTYNMF